jgi:hypothetical protein
MPKPPPDEPPIRISITARNDPDVVPLFPRKDWRSAGMPAGSDLPVEQQISDSRNATRDEGAFQPDAFQLDAFQSGGFGSGLYGAGPYGGGPITPEQNESSPDNGSQAATDRAPSSPIVALLDFDRATVTLHVRGLIEAFQEVQEYNPQRNVPPPQLWNENEDYLNDIKALVDELRRLNGILESPAPSRPEELQKSTSELAHAARKITDEAYGVIGKGLGVVILTSVGALITQLGSPDLGQMLMSAFRGGK